MKNRITRKGFTLVELLIVIVVIGILASMMMLSSMESVTTAKANNIVSNLRNLKTAALAYYTDNMDELSTKKTSEIDLLKDEKTSITAVTPYLSNTDVPDIDKYALVFEGDSNLPAGERRWYIRYHLGTVSDAKSDAGRVAAKLKGRAQSAGLLAGNSSGQAQATMSTYDNQDTAGSSTRFASPTHGVSTLSPNSGGQFFYSTILRRYQNMTTHKGLTMIEILIVITVIAILSSMMMMSSTESVSTSNAMNIITNLRNLSTAAMSLYTDNLAFCRKNPTASADLLPYVRPYLYKGTVNSSNEDDVYKNYCVKNFGGTWWAGYKFPSDNKSLKGKVSKYAGTEGLKGGDNENSVLKDKAYTTHSVVWMRIRIH